MGRFTLYYVFSVFNSALFHLPRVQLTILSYELGWLNSFKTETVETNITFSDI